MFFFCMRFFSLYALYGKIGVLRLDEQLSTVRSPAQFLLADFLPAYRQSWSWENVEFATNWNQMPVNEGKFRDWAH